MDISNKKSISLVYRSNPPVFTLEGRLKRYSTETVVISFTILIDGSVKHIHIVKSSGFKILDKNAMDAIEKIAPFPKPPVAAELTIPVFYKLS